MSHLTSTVPAALKKSVLPFLQRADELEASKQVLPAYFVRTYAAQEVLKKRDNTDPAQKAYLLDILGYLENFQKENKADLNSVDGRTVITKLALTLFDRADEQERQGMCSPAICKMLFTCSILLEATKQFTEGKMDPIATSKHKYARFIAARMTKSLKEGTKYEPVNQQTTQDELGGAQGVQAQAAAAEQAATALAAASPNQDLSSQLPALPSLPQNSSEPSSAASSNFQPPPPPPQNQQQQQQQQPTPSATPNIASMPPPPPPSVASNYSPSPSASAHTQSLPTPTQQQQQTFQQPPPPAPVQQQQQQQQQYQQPPPPPPSATTFAPAPTPAPAPQNTSRQVFDNNPSEDDLDKVMNSQKWAKQAIAALQFADVKTAKAMLQRAMDCLG